MLQFTNQSRQVLWITIVDAYVTCNDVLQNMTAKYHAYELTLQSATARHCKQDMPYFLPGMRHGMTEWVLLQLQILINALHVYKHPATEDIAVMISHYDGN